MRVVWQSASGTTDDQHRKLQAVLYICQSPRAWRVCVMVHGAALQDSWIETEFFGVEQGPATGVAPRIGKFQRAHGGTIFLDEIGDRSSAAQAKIVRVLQERMIERIGAHSDIPVDICILAATHKDLPVEVAKAMFREDLYYRLKVIHITTPPRRDMPDAIPLLAQPFLNTYCEDLHKAPKRLTPSGLKYLTQYPWPGNVRELQNETTRLVVLTRRSVMC